MSMSTETVILAGGCFGEAGPFWEAEAEDRNYLQRYPEGSNQFSPKPSAAG